ncbi:leucine-rich repeat protein [uncultured Rikenella sp.]|nr:leucine-rich repeat protein [uncultured Rikenella sp.]
MICGILSAGAILSACSEDPSSQEKPVNPDKPGAPELALSVTELNFSDDGGQKTLLITSNTNWAISGGSTWCSVDMTSGAQTQTVTVTTQANSEYDDRSVNLTIKAGGITKILTINQRKKDALTVTQSSFEVDGIGGSITIEIKHNIDFEVENQNAWISSIQTKALSSTLLHYQVEPNMRAFARGGIIVIRSGERSEIVTIRQAAYVPKKVIDVPAEGGKIRVTPTDLSYISKSYYKIYKTSPWIRQTPEDQSVVLPDKMWQFTIDKNELAESRTGEIVFSIFSPTHLDTIIVRQAAGGEVPTLLVSQSRCQVAAAGETISVEARHNVDITMEVMPEYASWIQSSVTKGLQTATRNFMIAANITDQVREGKIVARDTQGKLSDTIYITQSGNTGSLILDKQTVAVSNSSVSRTFQVDVITTGNFQVQLTDIPWCQLSRQEKIDNKTTRCTFTVEPYNGNTWRTGQIGFQTPTATETLSVLNYATHITLRLDGIQPLRSIIPLPALQGCSSLTLQGTLCEDDFTLIRTGSSSRSLSKVDIHGTNCRTLPLNAFMGMGLTSLTLPDQLEAIGDGAFKDMTKLSSVVIPQTVRTIGSSSFEGCTRISDLIIPNSISYIGPYAFRNCVNFRTIALPRQIRSVEDGTFSGCCNLTAITLPEQLMSIHREAFLNCSALTAIVLPNTLTSIGPSAFGICSSLTAIKLPDAIQSIEAGVFYHAGLTSVVLPAQLKSIGAQAFSGCPFAQIQLPRSITTIDTRAFADCKNLTSLDIPDHVLKISEQLCSSCSQLQTVQLPGSLLSIEDMAFANCPKLTTLTIPATVTDLGNKIVYLPFDKRTNQAFSLYMLSSQAPAITLNTFLSPGTFFFNVTLPQQSSESYQSAPVWQYLMDGGTIPHTVKVYTNEGWLTLNGEQPVYFGYSADY